MFKDDHPKKWLLLGVLLALVLIGLIVFFGLQARAEKVLPTAQPKAAKQESVLKIREVISPGGIKIWFAENHSLPVFSVKFLFRDSGSALDPQNKQGLARLLSNTMDEGAGKLNSEEFQKSLNDHSISLSFNVSRDNFSGELGGLSRYEVKAFELLALALNEPRFDTEAVARMKEANIARIKSSLSEPDWIAARLMNDRAFEGHPYAQNNGGTLSGLAAIMPDDLRAFMKDALTKDRLLVVAAGDLSADALGKAVDRVFGNLPEKADTILVPDVVQANSGKVFVYTLPIPQTMVEMAIPAFDHDDPDYYALQVMNYVLGGAGFGSRLMENAREKNGITYGIYSAVNDNRHSDSIGITTSTKNESAGNMLSIIKTEMERLKTGTVSDKELADAKSYLTGSIPLSLTSTEKIAAVMLSLRSDDLAPDYLDTYKEKIDAVTTADVHRVAERVLDTAKATTVLVGKPEKVENTIIIKEIPNVR